MAATKEGQGTLLSKLLGRMLKIIIVGILAAIFNFLGGSRVYFLKHDIMEIHARFGTCMTK